MPLLGILVSTAYGSESSNVGAVPIIELIPTQTPTPQIIYATVVVTATPALAMQRMAIQQFNITSERHLD